ncbi:hypothetical protein BN1723_007407 [Verticillium longisporum]|uniref:Histone-lysine N-methyltransferase, H3 lysine-36 specific n=1 Tax=Verticillium longisporum TaxID=100787 RepID=A0A0G4NL35_VERLO|nr:hypothetical protein BN1723_007407 [Verticillium longisporum]
MAWHKRSLDSSLANQYSGLGFRSTGHGFVTYDDSRSRPQSLGSGFLDRRRKGSEDGRRRCRGAMRLREGHETWMKCTALGCRIANARTRYLDAMDCTSALASLGRLYTPSTPNSRRGHLSQLCGIDRMHSELAPKAISKAKQEQQLLQSIIQQVTKETPKSSASRTPQQVDTPVQDPKKEKWRSLPIEKQMKIYENTLFPHVKYVLDKYRHKLPKEELKRLGKEVNKTLVSSDYRKNRVEDPTVAINHKKVKTIKQYVKDFLDRALIKFKERQSKKSERTGQTLPSSVLPTSDGAGVGESSAPTTTVDIPMVDADDDVVLSDVDDVETASASSLERKRKREQLDAGSPDLTPAGSPSAKRVKEDYLDDQAPPPPPPPPPEAEEMEIGADAEAAEQQPLTAEQLALREQEEALMRENEEAERLEAAERNSSANGAASLEEQRLALNGHAPNGGVILSGDAAPIDGPPQGGA